MDSDLLRCLSAFVGVVACLALSVGPAFAQQPKRATVVHVDVAPELDGIPDEPFWQRSTPATEFWENFLSDSSLATYPTYIYFASDGLNLYVAARCESPGDEYVIPSLRRDFRAGGNDNITFVFDPFRTGRNAIVFGTNPLGVNREALISNGGESSDDFQEAWDNKWRGNSRITEEGWSCELAIPLRSLRYPTGDSVWRFNAYRFDTQSNSRSSWNRIPRNQTIMSLGYQGELVWERAPDKNAGIGTLIPYVSANRTRDFESDDDGASNGFGIGGDAKLQLSSGLNLDLTVNPDFSQVEVDRQVINLTRFEVNFPERRQFFLENADLFGDFGFNTVNPFFSRRIGIARDTATGLAIANPIYYGARLNGQLDDRWRIGLLNMQAQASRQNGLPSYNYTVAAVQRRVGVRSSVGLIAVNKENFTDFRDSSLLNREYNRVVGVDYNLASADNTWNGKAFVHTSITPESRAAEPGGVLPKGDPLLRTTHGLRIQYRKRRYDIGYDHAIVPAGYRAEVGFVPRTDFVSVSPEFNYRFFPTSGRVAEHGPSAETRLWFDAGLTRYTDQRSTVGYRVTFRNTARVDLSARYQYTLLTSDFDPSRTGARALPAGTGYGYFDTRINVRTDSRKAFALEGELSGGQFFNGRRYGVEATASYRLQPYAALSLDAVYNYVDLPEPYATTGLLLLGPRVDLTVSKSLFVTGVAQYNDQIDNVNLNFRLQWRYAPVSDFFLVYTDNINSLSGETRNRAIVAKLTYWFNA